MRKGTDKNHAGAASVMNPDLVCWHYGQVVCYESKVHCHFTCIDRGRYAIRIRLFGQQHRQYVNSNADAAAWRQHGGYADGASGRGAYVYA
jgi:hypothetical protein